MNKTILWAIGFALIVCCNKQPPTDALASHKTEIQRGKEIYIARCSACHGSQPAVDSRLGPSTYGSSFDLLAAKMLSGTYPDNHKPKQNTTRMGTFPDLKDHIQALTAYLNSDEAI